MESLKELSQKRADLFAQNKALLARAEGEGRTLNSEESAEWDKRDAEIEALADQVSKLSADETRKQRLGALEQSLNQPLPRQTSTVGAARNDSRKPLSFDCGRAGKLSIRPDSPNYELASEDYADRFGRFLRGEGDIRQLGLKVSDDSKGGYTVPTEFAAGLIKFLDDEVLLRRLCKVMPPTSAKSVGMLSYDTDIADATWGAEVPASSLSEDDTARFGNREMTPHLMTTLLKASQQLVSSSNIDIGGFLAQRAAYKFGITENKTFLTGSGSQRPLGVFTASNDGVSTSRDVTAAGSTSVVMDDLINTKYNLKAQYQARGVWLMHRDLMKMIRKLKTGVGEYFMGINGEPDMLLGRPVYQDENAPSTFTASQYVALFFDPQFYVIQDGISLSVTYLGELFQLTNQVGWVVRKSVDAMPVLGEAFSRLKLNA